MHLDTPTPLWSIALATQAVCCSSRHCRSQLSIVRFRVHEEEAEPCPQWHTCGVLGMGVVLEGWKSGSDMDLVVRGTGRFLFIACCMSLFHVLTSAHHILYFLRATHTSACNLVWYFVLSLVESGELYPVHLNRSDLWPPLPEAQSVVVWDFADPNATATLVPGGIPTLTVLKGAGHVYKLVAPVMPSGWAFLGETDKLTPVSVQRNWTMTTSALALEVGVRGAPGEQCLLSAWKGGLIYRKAVVIDARGHGMVRFVEH